MLRFITGNWGWKLAALAISCLIWFGINGANDLTEAVSVPVQYRNLPANMDIGSELEERVHLILRGPSLLLSRASTNPPPVVIDLGEIATPGERTFPITAANVRLPGGVLLEKVMPGQIRLRLERRLNKEVAVHVRTEAVPEGMHVEIAEIRPAKLIITGPESRVRLIEQVETDPIGLNGPNSTTPLRALAYLSDSRVNFVGDPVVQVRAKLVPNN